MLVLPELLVQTIPSPSEGTWYLGPLPIRGYALSIILGIVAAIWIGERRWQARGGRAGDIGDLAIWGVPVRPHRRSALPRHHRLAALLRRGPNPVTALYIWRGGLGIWGAIALGAVGVMIGARLRGIKLLPLLDAIAPGVLVAQAIGRWGNWFNQELYGRPTDLPWGLEIDPVHRPDAYLDVATYHPTFLYECLWNLGAFGLIIWLDARLRLGFGRVAALYVMFYTLGRGWIENLRIDEVQLIDVGGLRLNVWTSIVLFLAATAYFAWAAVKRPGREETVYTREPPRARRRRARGGRADDESWRTGGV